MPTPNSHDFSLAAADTIKGIVRKGIVREQVDGLTALAGLAVHAGDAQLAADVREVQTRLRTALRLEAQA